jgi:hypothetical protein
MCGLRRAAASAAAARLFTRFSKMICDAIFLDALPSLNYTSAVWRTPQ